MSQEWVPVSKTINNASAGTAKALVATAGMFTPEILFQSYSGNTARVVVGPAASVKATPQTSEVGYSLAAGNDSVSVSSAYPQAGLGGLYDLADWKFDVQTANQKLKIIYFTRR